MSLNCKLLPDKGYERLEPDVMKVASPVLRGLGVGNGPRLLGNASNSITPSKGERLADNHPKLQWTDIDWEMVKEHVNRLQTRIAKAVKQGKWNLVKRLRYLLTHSFYAKLLAVKRVTQNKGKRTAGIDGTKWTTPNSKMNAALELSDKKYKAKPLRRVYIPKPAMASS